VQYREFPGGPIVAHNKLTPEEATKDMGEVLICAVVMRGIPKASKSGSMPRPSPRVSSMIRDLAIQPEQRRLLVEDPELLSSTAVEEFIRWVSPVLNMSRTATEDHELQGQQIHAGDQLLLLYASANRDERVFKEPDALDVTRAHNRHVAFGFGAHFCLGAQLARLEIRVMFEELIRRIPDWDLIDQAEPKIVPATFARAYDRIDIRFTTA
jgi:cholest-4-en-3-one 26-monooxygenase